jgi:hypothetical protein
VPLGQSAGPTTFAILPCPNGVLDGHADPTATVGDGSGDIALCTDRSRDGERVDGRVDARRSGEAQ